MTPMTSDGYRALRQRVLAITHAIDPTQVERSVPCCPAWTVHNLLSHMAGVPADIVAGNLEGVTTDPWTQAQVDARTEVAIEDLAVELSEKGSIVDTLSRLVERSRADVRGAGLVRRERDRHRRSGALRTVL